MKNDLLKHLNVARKPDIKEEEPAPGGPAQNPVEVSITNPSPSLPASGSRAQEIQEPGVLLSEIEPETVQWLWESRVPQCKLTVLDGDPGLGKSTVTLDIAARMSQGLPMPDGSEGIGTAGVVILSAEDGLADTIKPRLLTAGADCSRVLALTEVLDAETGNMRPPVIPDDIETIKRAIERVKAKLIIIDPLMAFLSGEVRSNRDQDVRRALHQIANLAESTGAAVLVVRHLNKSGGGNALYRGGGSIGIIGAARSGLLVAKDPDDENRRVLASIKSNLCKPPESLSFHLEDCDGVARVVWDGTSPHTADALLACANDQDKGALEEAEEILTDILSDGPVAVEDATKQARAAGIADRTLRRAKVSLNVISRKLGGPGTPWVWELPKMANPEGGSNTSNLGHLTGNEQNHSSELESTPEILSEKPKDGQTSIHGHLGHLKDSEPKKEPPSAWNNEVKENEEATLF